jgi:hypothetical protein
MFIEVTLKKGEKNMAYIETPIKATRIRKKTKRTKEKLLRFLLLIERRPFGLSIYPVE